MAASHQHAVEILKCIDDTFNVVNDSIECVKSLFFGFSPGQTLTEDDFCQFFAVLHKITYDCTTKLHGPSHQISKKTKHGKLYINRSS